MAVTFFVRNFAAETINHRSGHWQRAQDQGASLRDIYQLTDERIRKTIDDGRGHADSSVRVGTASMRKPELRMGVQAE